MPDVLTHGAVRELYKIYAAGDRAKLANILDEDIDWIIHGPVAVFSFEGPRRGREAVLQVLADIAKDYALERYEPEVIVVEGDRAAVMSDVSFTQRATGRVLRLKIAHFLRFREGRLIEFREFTDTFDAVEQALGTWLDVQKPATM